MPAIMTDTSPDMPHLLALLQRHARTQGDARCHLLPDRVITYRRFWARIERASARLQGEWGIAPGDTVAYVGQGHPDALVLYFALLRIGACLLPLEQSGAVLADAIAMHRPSLALYDAVRPEIGLPACPLHALLALWCTHDPHPVLDDVKSASLWLPVEEQWHAFSLDQLCLAMSDQPATDQVGRAIFNRETLCNIILPSLRLGMPLQFEQVCSPLG